MIETLDKIHSEFVKLPTEKRYEYVARLKRFFTKKPEYKGLYEHKLFIDIITFHIEQLQREQKDIQDLINKLMDRDLDGGNQAPTRYTQGRDELIKELSHRVNELQNYIEEYTADMRNRKAAQ